MLNEINTHQEPINGALLVPSSHSQARGGPGRDTNVQSRNPQKGKAEFLPIFFSFFPCFQMAASPLSVPWLCPWQDGSSRGGQWDTLPHRDAPRGVPSPGSPILPSHPTPASFPLFPSLPDTTHRGISEQTSWLWVVVMVRDCGAETPRSGGSISRSRLSPGEVIG